MRRTNKGLCIQKRLLYTMELQVRSKGSRLRASQIPQWIARLNLIDKQTRRVLFCVASVLFLKVLVSILYEYRWYFPPNFNDSAFLVGRQDSFRGSYSVAFYAHLLSGPVALLTAASLMLTGKSSRWRRYHRIAGRFQVAAVLVLAASGIVMAGKALAGPLAGYGFIALAACLLWTTFSTVYFALNGKIASHRRWATRCFILLCSPMLLRLTSGVAIVLQSETMELYRINAWSSWMIPWGIYEAYLLFRCLPATSTQQPLSEVIE